MKPMNYTIALAAADADGVCASQTPVGAGALTLDGALVSAGVAVLGTGQVQRQVLITAAADESGRVFTVVGTSSSGVIITETIAGPNATTVAGTLDYADITSVSVDAATAGAIEVGTNGVGSTSWFPMDVHRNPFNAGFSCDVTGTVNFTVQHTFEDVLRAAAGTVHKAYDHASVAAATADADGNYAFAVMAVRILINSGTGTVAGAFIQSGIRGG